MGQVSLFATKSLQSIDDWMLTCQGNLSGASRNAFKQNEVFFGGGLVSILNSPSQTTSGKMIAEQTLTTGYTRLKWTNGDLITSTEPTHFALQGDGFFLVAQPRNVTQYDGSTVAGQANNGSVFLTRDGEFHFAEILDSAGNNITGTPGETVLVTKEGLVVQGDQDSTVGPLTIGNSDNKYSFITATDFFDAVKRARPSVVLPSTDPPNTNAIASKVVFDQLKFSTYGSTVFNCDPNFSIKTIINGSANNLDRRNIGAPPFTGANAPSPAEDTTLVEHTLESANVDVAMNITEMAALGKMYNGFVQLIKVYNGTLDEVLGFIR